MDCTEITGGYNSGFVKSLIAYKLALSHFINKQIRKEK